MQSNHSSPYLTDEHGRIWQYTPGGLRRVPTPWYYRPINLLHRAIVGARTGRW